MRITSLFFCLLFSSTQVVAETSLWQVSNGQNNLFLGGTIHMLRPQDYPLPAEYDQALAQADSLVLEINFAEEDMAAFQQSILERASYQHGGSLEKTLSVEAWKSLQRYCDERGIDVYRMNNFKPVLVMLALFEVERQRLGISAAGVDVWYDQQARERGMPVHGLETLEEQTVFLLGMGVGNESAFMQQSVRDLEQLGPLMAEMIRAWRLGDHHSLDQMFLEEMRTGFPQIYRSLIVERNNNWLPRIRDMIDQPGTELVLVGAAHLIGKDGLLAHLRQAGYEVEPFTSEP